MTRAEVTAAYLGSRNEVQALGSEDSGSSYLTRVAAQRVRSTELAATEPVQGE
jgi:hypothetical protein